MTEFPQNGHGEKLSRRSQLAISALLSCPTIGEAAEVAGVGERTIRRWLKQPSFKTSYLEARRQTVEQTTTRLQQAGTKAVETLVSVMDDPHARASARVSAARVVLELAYRAVELEDFAVRVEALEASRLE